jgi:rRNA-processing protein FCF1
MSALVRPTVLLDEPVFGLEEYLRDLRWKIMKEFLGTSDDEIVNVAKENGYVVVSPDRKLLSRCRVLEIHVVDVGFEVLAKVVNESLERTVKSQP